MVGFNGDSVNFNATASMASFHSCILPLVTSITWIVFWHMFSLYLAQKCGRIKIIDFMADNSFSIMMNHLFFVCIPSLIILMMERKHGAFVNDFDISQAMQSPWYRYYFKNFPFDFLCSVV